MSCPLSELLQYRPKAQLITSDQRQLPLSDGATAKTRPSHLSCAAPSTGSRIGAMQVAAHERSRAPTLSSVVSYDFSTTQLTRSDACTSASHMTGRLTFSNGTLPQGWSSACRNRLRSSLRTVLGEQRLWTSVLRHCEPSGVE